jgi:hypothetical protein
VTCCPDNTESHAVIVALDSVRGHICSARDGARVDMPVLFTGGGFYTVCPYCHRSV